jgi:hypothetical protein
VVSPKFGPWRVLWIRGCPWLVRALRCFNYALNNFLFSLCRSMWIIELFVNLPSPILKLQHALLPSKCYKPGGVPQLLLLLLPLFTFGLSWVHQGAWGCIIDQVWLPFLVGDQGIHFINKVIEILMTHFLFWHTSSTTYYSQGNS